MSGKKKRKASLRCLFLLSLVGVLLLGAGIVRAAAHKPGFGKEKGSYYYWNENGKRLKGLQKIGENTFWFDKKGVQRTGWRKIGGSYYFFRIENGAEGYIITNAVINDVKLGKDGRAKLTGHTRRKLKMMTRCAQIADKLVKADQSKRTKLKAVFRYVMNLTRSNTGNFRTGSEWDLYYAEYILDRKRGDCFCQGALMAYMANAVGYSHAKAVSSGGHGWAKIDGEYYDPNWANVIGFDKCFGATSGQSGTGGRPRWSKNEKYVADLGATDEKASVRKSKIAALETKYVRKKIRRLKKIKAMSAVLQ